MPDAVALPPTGTGVGVGTAGVGWPSKGGTPPPPRALSVAALMGPCGGGGVMGRGIVRSRSSDSSTSMREWPCALPGRVDTGIDAMVVVVVVVLADAMHVRGGDDDSEPSDVAVAETALVLVCETAATVAR